MNTQCLKIGLQLGAAIAVLGSAAAASAGECPAASMRPDARTMGETMPKGVTDNVLGAVALGKEIQGLDGRQLRVRKLVIQPGGVVPWHSHGDRPALIYVAEGEIHEFASNCAAPIVHKAGDLRRETSEVSHWWKNLGDTTVILLVADVLHDRGDHNI